MNQIQFNDYFSNEHLKILDFSNNIKQKGKNLSAKKYRKIKL